MYYIVLRKQLSFKQTFETVSAKRRIAQTIVQQFTSAAYYSGCNRATVTITKSITMGVVKSSGLVVG